MSDLRERFIQETEGNVLSTEFLPWKLLVVAVCLPTGAIETITNTQNIQSKVDYYKSAYDDNFMLKINKEVQVVGYLLY